MIGDSGAENRDLASGRLRVKTEARRVCASSLPGFSGIHSP